MEWFKQRRNRIVSLESSPLVSNQWLKENLPVICQPRLDVENGNPLLAVFVSTDTNGQNIELRLIYRGESSYDRKRKEKMNRVGTWIYKIHNRIRYGRTIDITQLCYHRDGDSWSTLSTVDYNKKQTWNQGDRSSFLRYYSFFTHYVSTFSQNSWKLFPGTTRPIVYVNTCNHLHGPVNANSDLLMKVWATYPVYHGNAMAAERFAKTIKFREDAGNLAIVSSQSPLLVWE